MSSDHKADRLIAALQEWGRLSASPLGDPHDRMERLLTSGCRLLGMELGLVTQVDGSRSVIVAGVAPAQYGTLRGQEHPLHESFSMWTLRAAGPLWFHHAAEDERWRDHPLRVQRGIEAAIGCPVSAEGELWGSLNLYHSKPRAPFGAIDQAMIEQLASWIGHELTRWRERIALERYFERSSDLLAECSAEGRVLRANAAWERLGAPPAQLVGQRWTELVDRRDRAAARLGMEQAWASGSAQLEVRAHTAQGELCWFACLLTRDEELGQTLLRAHDVTALRLATERLQDAKEEAEAARDAALEANRAKSSFFAGVSHDLRTPMNGILGLTELLLESPLQSRQREWVEVVHQSGQSLMTLINDVLDLSRIEAKGMELQLAPLDPRLLAEEAALLVAERAQRKGLELAWRLEPGLPTEILGDASRIKQVLLNLLGNAVKFTQRGTVVLRLYVAPTEDPQHTMLTFEVQDSGPGIPADQREAIFEPFKQLHDPSTPRQSGSGLGLSIARQLVTLMGGAISLDSTPGHGSTFAFTLPITLSTTSQLSRTSTPLFFHQPRALIIERHAEHAQHLASMMSSWGVEIAHKTTLPGQRRILEDVVLLDIELPGAADWLRDLYAQSGVRGVNRPWLIALHPIGAALDVPADAHVERPVRRHILLQTLQRLLRERMLPDPDARRDVTLTLHEDTVWDALLPDLQLGEQSSSIGHILDEITSARAAPRALVVEDNATNIRLMREFMTRLGWEATIAETGEQALELLGREPWDVILMDCQLPGMSGYETARQIRAREARRGWRQPIYALTAHAMRGERERVLEAGMDDFLTKPISLQTLQGVLATLTRSEPRPKTPVPPARYTPEVEITLDEARWRQLLDDCGDPIFVSTLIEEFFEDAQGHIRAMQGASPEILTQRAHALRGASSQFGLRALVELCQALELAPTQRILVSHIEQAFARAQRKLREQIALAGAS